jgi:hypothetical protein
MAAILIVARVAGAGLLAAMGWIHLYLWADGYREIPTIGTLFLLNGIGAAVLAIALLGAPRRALRTVSVLAALFTLGTLAALIGSLTVGVFGFQEYLSAPYVGISIVVESVGIVVLGGLTAMCMTLARHRPSARRHGRALQHLDGHRSA